MNQNLQNILQSYDILLPSKEDGMIIFMLDQKIKEQEIAEQFSYNDFKQTVKELAEFALGAVPHSEAILKNLLNNFIERPPDQKHTYKLTEYAMKFISLVDQKLNNPYRKFPLRESFEKYTNFQAKDIQIIDQFESWFQQGFNNTTKQNIIDHLEALKDDVNQSIRELNQLLYEENSDILQTISKFTEIFKGLTEKTEEIRDTLRLGNNLEREIDKVVTHFYDISDNVDRITPDIQSQYKQLLQDYNKSVSIHKEVRNFFIVIDSKIGQLREKIVFASNKLNDLQHNFRYQSNYKINIKRFMELVLSECQYHKEGPILPVEFPIKTIPSESFKYTAVPYVETFFPIKKMVQNVSVDGPYQQSEKEKIEKEISQQQRITALVSHYKELLSKEKEMDFTQQFHLILERDQDIEIALNVSYELLIFAHHSDEYRLVIDPKLLKESTKTKIYSWQTNIIQK
ncbi:hypothetical protein [Flavobacterium sangjuense]|uniref:Uncharacterized protein n=1 Tax=Flavobacterium sangjuense TaxID=2518177 RepID=A0A4P7PVY7_9FLAO|nr:hypothetical protein [Flavobacterium sangjuense]QBZ98875.1 hypothetical protein GS03_02387 [Flavobacterium sangjuense]